MKIHIVSDLHLKNNANITISKIENCNTIILNGDIGNLYNSYYSDLYNFLKTLCGQYKHVLYIPGNHEYYTVNNCFPETLNILTRRLKRLAVIFKNLFVLDRSYVIINGVCIAGCTLWSDLKIEIPPFFKIHGITTEIYKNMFKRDVKFIKGIINKCKRKNIKLIMATHYPPSYQLYDDNFFHDNYKSLYYSNLEYLINKKNIHTWIYGHTHKNKQLTINGTNVVCNQKGHHPINNDFDEKYFIEI